MTEGEGVALLWGSLAATTLNRVITVKSHNLTGSKKNVKSFTYFLIPEMLNLNPTTSEGQTKAN